MGRTRNAHKKRLLERQKTTESAFYRRGHGSACGHLRGSSATRTRTRQLMTLMDIETTRKRARTQTQTPTARIASRGVETRTRRGETCSR